MVLLGLGLVLLICCFGFVLLFGAPYLPTLSKQVAIALDMADLKPGETLLELGCGDGKVLLAAARRGYHVIGYELNPLLVLVCLLRTWRLRRLIQVRWGNFMTQRWPECQAIFVFGLQRIMPQLDKKIMQSVENNVKSSSPNNKITVVSFAFTFPERQPMRQTEGLSAYVFRSQEADRLESSA